MSVLDCRLEPPRPTTDRHTAGRGSSSSAHRGPPSTSADHTNAGRSSSAAYQTDARVSEPLLHQSSPRASPSVSAFETSATDPLSRPRSARPNLPAPLLPRGSSTSAYPITADFSAHRPRQISIVALMSDSMALVTSHGPCTSGRRYDGQVCNWPAQGSYSPNCERQGHLRSAQLV
ncbi:hypothetical protein CI109_104949 [Kwoniella shandongensis]|uniref:Uncharacterized protein n=1 Tax=Kwoniella shandongensis TaxID=1734106 RepID=A0A5M6BNG1_9TREE|nr:uncharacterized protein CI109_007274 [Kwoniella shandongensis]KAA5524398.1 hypothetical protein CI109_007274 [Kwoniella shandongensis]